MPKRHKDIWEQNRTLLILGRKRKITPWFKQKTTTKKQQTACKPISTHFGGTKQPVTNLYKRHCAPFPIPLNLRHPNLALSPSLHAKHALPMFYKASSFPVPLRTAGLTNSVKHTPGLPQPGLPQRSPAQPGTNTALTKTSPHPEYTAQTLHSWHNTGPSNIPTHLGTQEQALT